MDGWEPRMGVHAHSKTLAHRPTTTLHRFLVEENKAGRAKSLAYGRRYDKLKPVLESLEASILGPAKKKAKRSQD